MLYDSVTEKYYIFIDKQLAFFILSDDLFVSFFSKLDTAQYNIAINQKILAINILAHELSHVEFNICVKRPEPRKSLLSGLVQQAYILLDEYYACRKAAAFSPKSLSDDDEFIFQLEKQIATYRWDYKTGQMALDQFCKQFHSLTEMVLIRLVSVLGAFHALGNEKLPFQSACISKRAPIFSTEFNVLFRKIASGGSPSMPSSITYAIYSYFKDLGVEIKDTSKGLYYHIPD